MTRDSALAKMGEVLVNYSVRVKRGDLVRISGSALAEPLIVSVYRQVLFAGGHPEVRMMPDECREIFLRTAEERQLTFLSPLALREIEIVDCSITIWGDGNTKALANVDPARLALENKTLRAISDRFLKRAALGALRWVGVEFPTNAAAQDAEMSLSEYEDFVFTAGLLHRPNPAEAWQEIHERQQCVCDVLQKSSELRFTNERGTDLRVGVAGRHWINGDGRSNFPDGEVCTGPIESVTNGVLCVSFPTVYAGREVDGIRLEFKDGRVVNASATKGEDFLIKMLDQDAGARILGEVGIGTNYSVRHHMKNALFDEKIGGTFHVALGAAYPESGGTNGSALHWDLVCDLRKTGRIEADGRLISESGRFLDSSWPQP